MQRFLTLTCSGVTHLFIVFKRSETIPLALLVFTYDRLFYVRP